MKKLVLFGIGQVAETLYWYFKNEGGRDISAFTVDRSVIQETSWMGLPVVPFDEVEAGFSPLTHEMFIAVGYGRLNQLRAERCHDAIAKGYTLTSFIHPKASNPGNVVIGPNTMILEYCVIQPTAKIGWNTLLWNGNLLGHHSEVGNHCFLAGNVNLGGTAKLGERCFVGMGSTIGHRVTVGDDSLVGAGSLLTKSVDANSVFIASDTPKFRLDSNTFMRMTRL